MIFHCRSLRLSRSLQIKHGYYRDTNSKTINVPVCILGGGPVGLLLSSQLSSYGIKHCVVERRETPTKHPQAHFMNARTMEILQAHLPLAFKSVLHEMPSSETWRDFVYCYSVAGRQFARLDQFKETDPLFWEESPTNVVHLPQNKFEVILRKEVSKNVGDNCELLLGYEAKDLNFTATGTNIVLKKSTYKKKAIQNNDSLDQIELNCDYLVAADGANSIVRRSLEIDLHGKDSMHTLMNVHFTCHGLRELLNPRPAMLYFVFNESLIAVFVAHDPEKDEWVCQIPIFPPFKNPEDFDKVTLQRLLRKGLGLPEQNKSDDKSKELEIDILTVNHWTMHAQVAEKFTNENTNVFLTGDAAHRFPPAGGFGMNTGLQDAHNIGWKLAMVVSGKADKRLLESYERERKLIAEQNTALSLQNYEKSASVARLLGVDPRLAKIATSTAIFADFVPLSIRKVAVNSLFDVGLSTLSMLKKPSMLGDIRVNMVKRMIDKKESLPLIFPSEDINFEYPAAMLNRCANPTRVQKAFKDNIFEPEMDKVGMKEFELDKPFTRTLLKIGGRVPHCWFAVTSQPTVEEKLSIISSVSLSGLLHSSLNNEVIKGSASKLSLPKVLFMVDQRNISLWNKAIAAVGNDSCTVIGIQYGQPRDSISASKIDKGVIYNHQELQEVIQDPHYYVVKSKKAVREIEPNLMTAYIEKKIENNDVKIWDLSGRWLEICTYHLETEDFSRFTDNWYGEKKVKVDPYDAMYCSTALRPDGHTIRMLNIEESTDLVSVKKFIQEVKNNISVY